jgi:hypothetical protein
MGGKAAMDTNVIYIVPDRKVDNSDSWSQNSQLAFHAGGLFLPRPSLNVEFLLSFAS